TGDDKTKAALAQFFNCGLRRDEEVLAHVTRIFARFDRPMLEVNRQQADVLDVAEVLFNEKGTAPGMWLAHEKKHFVVLPGVPFEMQHVMENQVLPRLRFMPGRITQWHHTFLTAGLG